MTVPEEFPAEVRIADISDFLRAVALFTDPEIEFTDEHVRISEFDGSVESFYPQAKVGSLVTLPVGRRLAILPPEHFIFAINGDQWTMIQKALKGTGLGKNDWQPDYLRIIADGSRVLVKTDLYYGRLSTLSLSRSKRTLASRRASSVLRTCILSAVRIKSLLHPSSPDFNIQGAVTYRIGWRRCTESAHGVESGSTACRRQRTYRRTVVLTSSLIRRTKLRQ